MKKQTAFTISFLFATFAMQGSSLNPLNPFDLNRLVECEIPRTPYPSLSNSFAESRPDSCATEAHRKTNASTTTMAHSFSEHNVSPLEAQIASSPEEPSSFRAKIIKISAHRYYVTCKPADVSEDWRSDSLVEANGHAADMQPSISKNELLRQKTYLAAALRGIHKQQKLSQRTTYAKISSKSRIVQDKNLLAEEDTQLPTKDCRTHVDCSSISKREERSCSNNSFWERHQDPAFWN